MRIKNLFLGLLIVAVSFVGFNPYSGTNNVLNAQEKTKTVYPSIPAGKFDMGKMWTFDYPPVEYFNQTYGLNISDEWLNKVRMSALKFDDICSASFVSEDGLVMTNHHCGRDYITKVSKSGEELEKNGFFAATLADERKVEGLFVQQLVKIIDVTADVQSKVDKGTTDKEKVDILSKYKKQIEDYYAEQLNLKTELVSFYNGGKYSIYGYKVFNDVRLVFAPETDMGFYGGDNDNFTYPRYDLDCSFFRVYDNDKPLKSDYFFKWSRGDLDSGNVVFVVGNPGSTGRLKTVAELEYMRDYLYPTYVKLYSKAIDRIKAKIEYAKPDEKAELENTYFSYTNGLKSITGTLKGLNDINLIARKKSFEDVYWKKINDNSSLKQKYGNLKQEISDIVVKIKDMCVKEGDMAVFQPSEALKGLQTQLEARNLMLGRVVFEIYGTSIPPDATFTLRISDGTLSSYEYNGTVAPVFTTFYGLYERYFAFKKQFPYNLPERWKNAPSDLVLSTPFNFIATNDIVGGNSGSPVINQNAEIVGLAFDGNIESLPSDFIYTTESNRMVSVDSRGLAHAVKVIYKADRLYNELVTGKTGE